MKGIFVTNLSKEEIKKLAAMTKLHVAEDELEQMQQRLQTVLDYAQRVQLIAKDVAIPLEKNINHDRPDQVLQQATDVILAQAPQQEDGYFVVPKIIDEQ